MKKFSDEIIAEAIVKFYKEHKELWVFDTEKKLVVVFDQKYEFEDKWEHDWSLITYDCKKDLVISEDDFCEGQTEVKNIKIYDLYDVLDKLL